MSSPYRIRVTHKNNHVTLHPVPDEMRDGRRLHGDAYAFAVRAFSHSNLRRVVIIDWHDEVVRIVSDEGVIFRK